MFKIQYQSDAIIELNGPVEKTATGEAAVLSAGTSSCKAYVFNDANDAELSVEKAASATSLSITPTDGWSANATGKYSAALWTGTTGVIAAEVVTVATAGTLTVGSNSHPSALVGTRVSNLVAPSFDLAAYNEAAAVVGTYDWGFRGTLDSQYVEQLKIGQRIRIEIRIVTSTGYELVETMYATVVSGASAT